MFTEKQIALFWVKVNKNGPFPDQSNPHYKGLDQCWEWNAGRFQAGYGAQQIGEKLWKTHRASFAIHFGEIPNGLCVLHKCDNRGCVNPNHLVLGSSPDNTKDRHKKRRDAKGTSHGMSKLTEETVIAIRNIYATGTTSYRKLAKMFGVNKSNIMRAIRLETWNHVKL